MSGSTTRLTATTLKHGSDYQVAWTVVDTMGRTFPGSLTDQGTHLNPGGYYVSEATFSPQGLLGGTYNINYQITMTAGASAVAWTAADSVVVTVPGAVSKPVYE